MSKLWRLIPPKDRNRFPPEWRGMDLRGMKTGDRFLGCTDCGVQFPLDHFGATSPECPMCLRRSMSYLTVTKQDVAAGAYVA